MVSVQLGSAKAAPNGGAVFAGMLHHSSGGPLAAAHVLDKDAPAEAPWFQPVGAPAPAQTWTEAGLPVMPATMANAALTDVPIRPGKPLPPNVTAQPPADPAAPDENTSGGKAAAVKAPGAKTMGGGVKPAASTAQDVAVAPGAMPLPLVGAAGQIQARTEQAPLVPPGGGAGLAAEAEGGSKTPASKEAISPASLALAAPAGSMGTAAAPSQAPALGPDPLAGAPAVNLAPGQRSAAAAPPAAAPPDVGLGNSPTKPDATKPDATKPLATKPEATFAAGLRANFAGETFQANTLAARLATVANASSAGANAAAPAASMTASAGAGPQPQAAKPAAAGTAAPGCPDARGTTNNPPSNLSVSGRPGTQSLPTADAKPWAAAGVPATGPRDDIAAAQPHTSLPPRPMLPGAITFSAAQRPAAAAEATATSPASKSVVGGATGQFGAIEPAGQQQAAPVAIGPEKAVTGAAQTEVSLDADRPAFAAPSTAQTANAAALVNAGNGSAGTTGSAPRELRASPADAPAASPAAAPAARPAIAGPARALIDKSSAAGTPAVTPAAATREPQDAPILPAGVKDLPQPYQAAQADADAGAGHGAHRASASQEINAQAPSATPAAPEPGKPVPPSTPADPQAGTAPQASAVFSPQGTPASAPLDSGTPSVAAAVFSPPDAALSATVPAAPGSAAAVPPPHAIPPPPPQAQLAQAAAALTLSASGSGTVTIRLAPAELGQVQIHIAHATPDGTASVRIAAERPETLAALQTDLGHLHQALDRAGVSGTRTVSFELSPAGDQASGQGQSLSGGGAQDGQQNARQDRPAPQSFAYAAPLPLEAGADSLAARAASAPDQTGLNITA